MSAASKPIRSPSYPAMSLEDAVTAVGKIEAVYRSAPVERGAAAKLVGYSSLSGPANKALAALASYGLLERAGKGDARVTERARAILHADDDQERKANLVEAAMSPALFRAIREKFREAPIPPEDGVITYLNREGFNPSAVQPATRAFLQTMRYLGQLRATESHVHQSPVSAAFGPPKAISTGESMTNEQAYAQEREAVAVSPQPRFAAEPVMAGNREEIGTDLRMKLGKGVVVQVRSQEELGPEELGKLIRLLEAQREALT
ncbi:MAG: hypothetical protein AcusKO_45380 [Acuticoccus sp.]